MARPQGVVARMMRSPEVGRSPEEAAVRMVRPGKEAGSGIGLAGPAAVDTGREAAPDSPDTAGMVPGREPVRAVDSKGPRGSGVPGRIHRAAGRRSPAGVAAGRSKAVANSWRGAVSRRKRSL